MASPTRSVQAQIQDVDGAPASVDDTTHTLQVIDYPHHEIHSGSHYTLTYGVADLGAATSPDDAMTLTFVTPNTAKWMHITALFSSVGGALVRMIEGGSGGASPAGAITCKNNNRNSLNTSGVLDLSGTPGQISYDAGLDSNGIMLIDEYIAGKTTNQSSAGDEAESGSSHEWVLKQNTRYQFSIFSTENAAASIVLHWYEHTDKS